MTALAGQVHMCTNARCGKRLPVDNVAIVGSFVVICGHCGTASQVMVAMPGVLVREQC